MSEIMNQDLASALLSKKELLKLAKIYQGNTQRPFSVQKITLNLSNSRLETDPFKIGFPFKSLYVQTATDVYVSLNVKLLTRDTTQSSFPIRLNDTFTNEDEIAEAYLDWSAQPGKSITLIFFLESEFKSGSQISVTGGGVSIVDGSSIALGTITLSAATAAAIAPADPLRKKATIQNKTGADLYVGASTVTNAGATEGILIPNNGIVYWNNTSALYGYSVSGGKVQRIEEK
jgi:hypothetical protein